MSDELKNALTEFVRFAQSLRGDEKSEAQSFLNEFFRALGHEALSKRARHVNFASRKSLDRRS